ncbi:hypothetical protein JZ751_014642, partial [Albula glossodonta]
MWGAGSAEGWRENDSVRSFASSRQAVPRAMMRGLGLCAYLALLVAVSVTCQGRGFDELQELPQEESDGEGQDVERDLVSINILNRHGVEVLGQYQPLIRKSRSRRPPSSGGPKRSPQGARYALSLDVPTNILN